MSVLRLAWGGPADALRKGLSVSTVRLAVDAGAASGVRARKALAPTEGEDVTTVRLVGSRQDPGPNFRKGLGPTTPEEDVSTVRLVGAHAVHTPKRRNKAMGWEESDSRYDRPALLVSYYYLRQFERERHHYHFRDWSMDSGAFSAANAGKKIEFDEYMETCKRLLATDPQLVEVFSLDVIGDWRATARNTERMWAEGIPAIPTFHVGEPEAALLEMAKTYPKIALGGAVGWSAKKKQAWVQQCFARVWPKKIHGLGMQGEALLMSVPFHSIDASSWEMAPTAFGNWKAFGGALSVRGGEQNLRAEVEWYLRLEQRLRIRWKKEMELLDSLEDT